MSNSRPSRPHPPGRPAAALLAAALVLLLPRAAAWGTDAQALWQEFRAAFPFHIQTLAVGGPDEKGGRVLVIAEPPPGFGAAEARAALAAAFPDRQVLAVEPERAPVGYDGWVEDLVVTLGPAPAGEADTPAAGERRLRELAAYLSRALFGTSYKAYALRLPVERRDAPMALRQAPPSLGVGAAELKRWLLDEGRNFVRPEGGEPATLAGLAAGGATGAYLSAEPGLALLVLRRDQDLAGMRGELRKFALDSDLVLGAVALGESDLAIVGRERQAALDVLPPLRAESILTLAAARAAELAQSYERNRVFAGKLTDGEDAGRDWAPIHLSDQLVDTEVGSLLNLTDQLLKSWSQAGQVGYVNFPYPEPDGFPFGDKALSTLTGGRETLFNWNTTGLGSITAFDGGVKVYALERTGSLPVTYGSDAGSPDDEVRIGQLTAFEEKAYDYFSARRDPNLARVVQYTAFYQIFRAFPVVIGTLPQPDAAAVGEAVRQELVSTAASGLKLLANLAYAELSRLERTAAADGGGAGEADSAAAQDPPTADGAEGDGPPLAPDDGPRLPEPVLKTGLEVVRLGAAFGPGVVDTLADLLADPRGAVPPPEAFLQLARLNAEAEDDDSLFAAVKALPEPEREPVIRAMLLPVIREFRDVLTAVEDLEAVRDAVVQAAAREPAGHVRTPSIVLSWNTVRANSVGGHNLDSAVTRIESAPGVARGRVEVAASPDGAVTLRVNPEDAAAAAPMARTYARNAEDPGVAAKLERTLAQAADAPARPLRTALALEPKAAGRGLSEAEARGFVLDGRSFRTAPERFTTERFAQARALAERLRYDLVIERVDEGGFVIFRAKPPTLIDAQTTPALVELVEGQARGLAGQHPPRILFRNFAEGEVDGLVRSSDLRSLARGGGGGREPPPPPASLAAAAPGGPERPFVHLRYGEDGKARSLQVSRRGPREGRAEPERIGNLEAAVARIADRPNWAGAEIRRVAFEETRVVGGKYADHFRLDFEVTIPVVTVAARPSLPLRIAAFVERVLGRAEIGQAEAGVRAALDESARRGLTLLDGIDELKQGLERTLGPAGIEFYLKEGAGDLVVVEREEQRQLDGRGGGLVAG